jgi:hypothetical protein
MVKCPDSSVIVPCEIESTIIFTPGIEYPVSESITNPLKVCAEAKK